MSFLALVALISAWIFRRRLYPGAKHELLLPKERHCQRRTRDHELKWSEPLDGRYRYVRVVGVMYPAPGWCPGSSRCRRHGGHHGRHESLQQTLLTVIWSQEIACLSDLNLATAVKFEFRPSNTFLK